MLSVAAYRLVTLAVIACLVSQAHALAPNRKFSQYVREKWSAPNGLPGGAVHAIAQSPDGYLWIGTDKGLVRFDGFTFLPVPPKSLLPQNDPILGLTTDAEGDLWVRMQTAGILRYNRGKFENLASGPNATVSQVTVIARENGSGMLLSDLISGTLRLRNGKLDLVAPQTILPGSAVTMAIAETTGGKIWLGTLGAGLFYLENGRVTRVTRGLTEKKINCLLAVGEQELWVGTDHGLFRWNGTAFRRAGLGPSLSDQPVLTVLRDRDSNIWVGTARGLLRIDRNGTPFAEEERLQRAGAVNALFEDREGNLWVGDAMGLERIRDSAFITYSTDNGPSSNAGSPVYVDREDRAWFAPEKGGLYWIKDGHIHPVTPALLGKDVIYSIAGRDQEIWIGRRQGGLTHVGYSSGQVTTETYSRANGLAQNSVYVTYQSHDGAVWAGTLNNGISRLKDGKFTTYTTTNGLASNAVSAALEGHDGTMWFGTPNGLSTLANGQWRTYSVQDGLPSDNVNCLFEDSAGALWIGTSAGLAYFQMGRIHTAQEVPESLHEQIVGMAEDKSARLWIATSNHVLRVSRDKLLSGVVKAGDVREYGQADGLESTEGVKRSQSVVSDSAGRIWFSLRSGLSVVDSSQITDNSVPALPRVEAITADDSTASLDASVRIPPSPRRITFEYTGLSLVAPERIRFRYFLENFDRGWSQPVAAREAVYTNLGPGSYRFRLVASNSEGLWNGPETAIALKVAPAYYQTVWFRTLGVFLFLAVLTGLYRLRLRHLERQRDALRKSEKELRDVIDTIPAAVWSALPDGSNTYANQRFVEYLGLSAEQTAGSAWQAAIHPDDLEQHAGKWMEAVATGRPHEIESRYRRSDGQYRWHLDRGVPLRDEDGNIVKWYGVATDIEDRKRAEEALQQNQSYLSEGQRLAHMGSWAFNPAGFFEYWSQELFKIYGLDPQKGAPTLEQYLATVHPQDRDFMTETVKRICEQGSGCDVKKRIIRPDGAVRYVRCVGIPVLESGVLKRFLGTAIDITEQELLTQELERQQAHLTEAQKLTHTGSWAWRLADRKTVHLSEEFYRIYGFDPAQGAPSWEEYFERIYPEDRLKWTDTIERAIAEKTDYDQEFRFRLPNGKVKWIRTVGHPVLSAAGDLEQFVGSSTDITERKHAEEALRSSEAYLSEAQNLTHTGSCAMAGANRETLYWSDEMFRLFGFDPQQGLPMFDQWLQRIHPDDRDKVNLASESTFLTKVNCDVEFRIVQPDGTVKHIHGIGHPVLSATGELVQVLGTMVDVTERKRAEEARDRLRQLEDHLAHINRVSTLGEIAASLAHEIKQPIAAAITSANSCIEWLAHQPPNLDRARAAAARIDKYGNRAAEIIDRIRSFYKNSPPQRELVDVNGIIQEMLTLLKGEADRYSVAMSTELATELPKVTADRVQLQQVFMNLMVNGIEAMSDSGGELTVNSQLENGQLQFSICDTGVGLPTEKMDQIFSAFFTTKPQGSGMGLAISRSIVESHGGRLWATANDGRGATFHFTWPTEVTEPTPLVA